VIDCIFCVAFFGKYLDSAACIFRTEFFAEKKEQELLSQRDTEKHWKLNSFLIGCTLSSETNVKGILKSDSCHC
jgi:hypothetical protein